MEPLHAFCGWALTPSSIDSLRRLESIATLHANKNLVYYIEIFVSIKLLVVLKDMWSADSSAHFYTFYD